MHENWKCWITCNLSQKPYVGKKSKIRERVWSRDENVRQVKAIVVVLHLSSVQCFEQLHKTKTVLSRRPQLDPPLWPPRYQPKTAPSTPRNHSQPTMPPPPTPPPPMQLRTSSPVPPLRRRRDGPVGPETACSGSSFRSEKSEASSAERVSSWRRFAKRLDRAFAFSMVLLALPIELLVSIASSLSLSRVFSLLFFFLDFFLFLYFVAFFATC